MPRSTPISQLNKGDNSEMVQNILNDMEQPQMPEPMTQMRQPQPPMQPPMQQPMEQPEYDDEGEDDEENYQDYGQGQGQGQMAKMPYYPPGMMGGESLMDQVKGPLIVVVLFILLNLDMVNQMMVKYIPKISAGGNVNMMGLVLKGVVAGLIFYLVKRFL